MGFGPMAARGDAAAPQRLTMEDWMSRSAVFRQQHPELAPRVTASTPPPPATTPTPATTYEGTMGDRAGNSDPSRDLRSFASIGDYFNDPQVQRDGRALLDMGLGVANPAIQAFAGNGIFSGQVGPQMPAGGVPGATPSSMQGSFSEFNDIAAEKAALDAQIAAAEAAGQAGDPTMGGGVGVNAADLGAEPNAPGMFARGGVVRRKDMRGPNPPGPDQGFVGVHAGEMILNKPQQRALAQALMGRRGR